MGRSVSKSTLGAWLTKKAWLSLAAVVVGLLAASISMSLPGSSVVSAQSNSAPTVSISSPSSPVSLYTGQSRTFTASATDSDNNLSKWKWEARRDRLLLPDFVYTPGEQTFDTTPTGSVTKSFPYTFDTEGDWTVKVTFTDSEGESGSVSWDVDVEDRPNRAPSISQFVHISYPAIRDVSQPFRVSASDADNDLVKWKWEARRDRIFPLPDFVYSPGEQTLSPTPTGTVTKDFSYAFDTKGDWTVKVTFTDSEGESDSETLNVKVYDPITVQLGATEYTVSESAGTAAVTVTTSGSLPVPFSVRLSTSDVTAVAPGDYSRHLLTVAFNANQTTRGVNIAIVNDLTVELDETFTVGLTRTSSLADFVTVSGTAATVTIEDDDTATVGFERNKITVNEDSDSFVATLDVTSPAIPCRIAYPIVVHFSHTDPDDALSSGSTVPSSAEFSTCSFRRAFEVDIGDVRGTEEVVFTLDKVTSSRGGTSDGRVSLVQKSLTVTILDSDDPSVTVGFGRTYQIVRESDGSVDIPVTISASPVEDVTVNLLFDGPDDTADFRYDFSLPSRRYVTFEADTTTLTQNITVTILDSVDVEFPESFFAVLQLASSTPPFASIPESNRVAEVEIIDDDTGTVGFVDDEVEVNEGDSFRLGIGVSKPAGTPCPIQFPIDVHFSYTDPSRALSPISTRNDLEHVSGNAYKALFDTCQVNFYFTVSTRDVSADSEAEFTLDSLQHPDGTQARAITIGSPSTMKVKVLDGKRPTETVSVTVASSPSGRTVTVDGTNRTAPYTATWNSGSSHTLNVPSPQNITGVSSRYVFSSWSQGGSQSQTVRPTSNRTYTANFTLQHFLSTRSSPTGPGVAGGGQWYDHNSTAFVGPAPTVAGYNFSYWRKDGQSIGTDPAGVSVTVDGPTLVEAVFTPAGENRPPTIADDDLSPSTESVILFAGTSQTFEARATDLDNNISSVVWYVDDVVVWDPGSVASIPLTGDLPSSYDRTFSAPDTHTVKVTFTDAEGATASHSWTVQVDPPTEERAPTVERIAPEEEEISLYTTQTQDFTVEATDVNGDIAKWKWVVDKAGVLTDGHEEEEEFDEETGSLTKEFSHPFDDDGSYTVTVTFTDSEGESGSVEWEVEVEDGPDLAVEDLEVDMDGYTPYKGPVPLIFVDMQIRNHGPVASGEYEAAFYFKNTGLRFIREEKHIESGFVEGIDIPLAILTNNPSGSVLADGEKKKVEGISVDIPADIKAGPYWLCAQIEHKAPATEPIPDPKIDNNADCTLTYVVSDFAVAEWVYPVAPDYVAIADYDDAGRFWLGVPRVLFKVDRMKEQSRFMHAAAVPGTRIDMYRDVALEIASRKALIETEGDLAIVELKKHIDKTKGNISVFGTILFLYEAVHKVSDGLSGLPKFADVVLDAVDFTFEGLNLYVAILVNRAINIDNALATLEVLKYLDIDNEYDGKASEWRLGVSKARDDVLAMTSESEWEQAVFAANELAVELIASGVKLVLGVLGKAGVVVKGIALGSAKVGAVIFAIFAILSALVALGDHWDSLAISMMAGQVYAELYENNARGDRLEVLTYAKYVAYDRAYQAEDNWLATVGAILKFSSTELFKKEAASLRDAALEEARAVVRVAEIEFDPSHYFLEVGEELKLAPTFISVSGNKMIGFGVEWTNYAGVNEAIDIDVSSQVVIGRAPGDARVVASIGDVHGSVTFTVIGNSICSNGAVADATNLGLLDDCEALLVARDTLAGTATLNWSETTPISQWDGVSLGGTPQRVTRLNLAGKGLSGTIPSVLGRLSMLTHLNLRSNDGLTGGIPSELGYLSNLRVLNLHSNSHSGPIPDLSGASSLEELYLPNNADYNADGSKVQGSGLRGRIPTWLNGMTNMRELWLWGNSLSGSIPDLSGMSSLQKLKLANNMLTGGVPDGSKLPSNMTWLIIDRNPLGGTIPDLSSLTRLKLLWLHSSDLTGNIPPGNNFSASLDDLNLRDNSLTGTIPDLSNLDNLTRLRLHNNSLSGEVPGTLGGLDSLKYLWLHNEVDKGLGNNSFTSIAAGVGGLADTLIQIALNGNSWAGDACVPAALANVAKNDYADAGVEVCSADDGS